MKKGIIYLFFAASLLVLPANDLKAQANLPVDEMNAPLGGSIEQIVSFYNQRANEVKAVDRITIIKNIIREVDMQIPLALRQFMPREMSGPFSNQNITIIETFINGEGTDMLRLNDFLPVSRKPYVSRLLASHVLSANCVMQGSNFIATIRLKEEPFEATRMNAGDVENISEADRESLMDDMLSMSGYASSMDLGFAEMVETERRGSRMPSGAASRIEGGFQNGTIIAVFNQEGHLISLTHSFNMSMNGSFQRMRVRINSVSRQEYQFIYPHMGY